MKRKVPKQRHDILASSSERSLTPTAAAAAAAAVPTSPSPTAASSQSPLLGDDFKNQATGHKVCQNMITSAMARKLKRTAVQKKIKAEVLRLKLVETEMFQSLPVSAIKGIYDLYDKYVFNGYLNKEYPNVVFGNSIKSNKVLGYYEPRYQRIRINGNLLMSSLQTDKPEACNGVVCHTHLDILLNVFEHELVHLIVQNNCKNRRKHHGEWFQAVARQLFGHTQFRHSLGRPVNSSEYDEEGGVMLNTRARFKPGERVDFKMPNGNLVKNCTIKKLNPTRALLICPEKKKWRVGYTFIRKRT